MNYREKMREYLKEPNFLNHHQYGKWGILNREQRQMITRLLDEMDRADIYIKELFFKNEVYENMRKELIEYIHDKFDRFDCDGNLSISMQISYCVEDLLNILNKVGGSDE
jgi:hypothetical protein